MKTAMKFPDLETTARFRGPDRTMVVEADDIVEIRELGYEWDATTVLELDDHTQVDIVPFGARIALVP